MRVLDDFSSGRDDNKKNTKLPRMMLGLFCVIGIFLGFIGIVQLIIGEFEAFFGRTADEVSAIQSFGELPLTVIGATEPDPGFGETGPAFRQFWNEENQALARKSASGQFILAEGSSHHIHLDTPQLVIDAILELVS